MFKWVVILSAIFLAFYILDFQKTISSLSSVSLIYVFYSTSLLMLASIISGTRWVLFCRGFLISDINYLRKLKVNFAASALGYMFPVAGGSDAFRAMSVSINRSDCGLQSFFAIAASRTNGFVVALLSLSVSSFFLNVPLYWQMYSVLFSIVCFVLVFYTPLLLSRFDSFKKVPLKSVALKKAWYKAFVLSFVFQMILVSSRALLGWELGVNLSWGEFIFISSLLFILSPLLPSFGFIGLGTLGFVYFASLFDVPPEHAVSLSVAWYACWVISSLPGFLFMKELNMQDVLKALRGRFRNRKIV